MTLRQAARVVEYYRERFGLSAWTITVQWMPKEHTKTYHAYVEFSDWSVEHCTAIISLEKKATEHEKFIIHELLHLRLEGHRKKPKGYDAQYEHALNVLAETICNH